jgi:hypothetical protein
LSASTSGWAAQGRDRASLCKYRWQLGEDFHLASLDIKTAHSEAANLLRASTSTDDFLARLENAGFTVKALIRLQTSLMRDDR